MLRHEGLLYPCFNLKTAEHNFVSRFGKYPAPSSSHFMRQMTFANVECRDQRKQSRKEHILGVIDQVAP